MPLNDTSLPLVFQVLIDPFGARCQITCVCCIRRVDTGDSYSERLFDRRVGRVFSYFPMSLYVRQLHRVIFTLLIWPCKHFTTGGRLKEDELEMHTWKSSSGEKWLFGKRLHPQIGEYYRAKDDGKIGMQVEKTLDYFYITCRLG